MDELQAMLEQCKKMAYKLEAREAVADNAHVAQLWHCMSMLCSHLIQFYGTLELHGGKK